ncbi:hypothetical protein, partial [Bifidobacterium callimiconis]|uniref:hypothetical protein n=1 Tax=Bifidobacterium callimiconis TaxID=2306973 RepID=UPI0019D195DE
MDRQPNVLEHRSAPQPRNPTTQSSPANPIPQWMLLEAVYDLLRPAFYAGMKNTVGDIGAIVIFLALLCFCLS